MKYAVRTIEILLK